MIIETLVLREGVAVQQLVGQPCAICQERINSILDGDVCNQCLRPYHPRCRKAAVQTEQSGICTACGSSNKQPPKPSPKLHRPTTQRPTESSPDAIARGEINTATRKSNEIPTILRVFLLFRAAKWLVGAAGCIGIGIWMMTSPMLRTNPNHISFNDIGIALIPIFAGIVLIFLAYWVASIRK